MAKPLTDLHAPLRALLGDLGHLGVYDYSADQLSDALRAVFDLGEAPPATTLSVDRTSLDPDPVNLQTTGHLVLSAAILITGGSFAGSYRTRPISANRPVADKRLRLDSLEGQRRALEATGLVGSASATTPDSAAYIVQDLATLLGLPEQA